MDNVLIVAMAIMVVVFIVGVSYGVLSEKAQWNNGVCKVCGAKWKQFDMDSQGGRMYRCENWHYCDISYSVDKELEK